MTPPRYSDSDYEGFNTKDQRKPVPDSEREECGADYERDQSSPIASADFDTHSTKMK